MLSQRGSHILEFSLVIFFLFFFIAGAFDINTALQSYTALQEGVKKTLRCSYTTDSECVTTDLGTREALYNVVKFPNPEIDYYINRFDYGGVASWFEQTDFDIKPEVTVADLVTYSYNKPLSDEEISNPVNNIEVTRMGTIAYYVRTHILPSVSGLELTPSFSDFPSANQIETDRILTADANGVVTIPAIKNPFTKGEKPVCFEKNSYESAHCDTAMARILIHVDGSASGSGQGAVDMELYDSRGNLFEDLGGRQVNGDTNYDNFAVRGIYCGSEGKGKCLYDPTLAEKEPGYVEPKKYKHLEIPYGEEMTLRFKLKRESGSTVSWKVKSVRLFNSRYEHHTAQVNCEGWVPASAVKSAKCISNHPSKLSPPESSIVPVSYKLNGKVYNYNQPRPDIEVTETADCGKNYGKIGMESDCRDICSFPVTPKVATCTTKVIKFPTQKFSPTCEKSTFIDSDVGEEFLKYPIREIKRNALTPYMINTKEDPRKLAQTDTYKCGIPRLVVQSFEGDEIPNDSLFRGTHPDLGCNWQEALKQHAIKDLPVNLRIDSGAFFEANRVLMDEVESPGKPIDLCTAYRSVLKDAGNPENLGQLPYSALPRECIEGKAVCKVNFLGYTPGTAASSGVNTATAISEYGIPEIQSSFPRASFKDKCSGDYCTEIKEIPTGDENMKSFSAKMSVPLTLLKIAGFDSVDITYQDSHRLEKAFSK